jgi:hypothetical protein
MLSAVLLSGPTTPGVSTTPRVATVALSKNSRSSEVKFAASDAETVSKI